MYVGLELHKQLIMTLCIWTSVFTLIIELIYNYKYAGIASYCLSSFKMLLYIVLSQRTLRTLNSFQNEILKFLGM